MNPENSYLMSSTRFPELCEKVLLLGSACSGKSTILKQMRLIYGIPFSPAEIESFRQLVFDNLANEMKFLIDSLPDLGLTFPEALRPEVGIISQRQDLLDWDPFNERLSALSILWSNETIQSAVRRGNEVALEENLHYFFSALPRLFSLSYVPTHDDILHLRARTIGINETMFHSDEIEMMVVDVSGVKAERRKWIHMFIYVTDIIFAVSLNGYDMTLVEDRDQNQMQDSMIVWEAICASRSLDSTSIILCLTKNDLFERKVVASHIADFFPDFNGPRRNAVVGRNYFIKEFRRLANKVGRVNTKAVHIHVVTATDTELMRGFMNSVGTAVMRTHLQDTLLI
ncbi:guanine nucleotide binding protein, alpha subunit [Mycena vulgaris]|nr:guanine nucleotide binding protein, alpha subunit [Mycena vulgaris]